jgi:ADP-ribose pyrophosphatase YjhB (NUDIX family)
MISFDKDGILFTLRTVAIFLHNDVVLLHKGEGNDFWSFPGGRVEAMESSEDALIREMKEELHTKIRIIRLLWIIENFYKEKQKMNHEIGFYYLSELPNGSPLYTTSEFDAQDGSTKLLFKWHPLKNLHNLCLYPAFFRTALSKVPKTPECVVNRDTSLSE